VISSCACHTQTCRPQRFTSNPSGMGRRWYLHMELGGNALSWWQQTAFFSAGFRCITFDHPGFRNSSWSVPESDPEAYYGNVLVQLLDHLGVEKVALIAQSMGGWTCLRFAIDHPERTAALVMAATDAGMMLPHKDRYADQVEELAELRKAWAERRPCIYNPACGNRMKLVQPALYEMYFEISSQNGDIVGWGWGEVHASEPLALQVPTLFVTGTEDDVISPERVEALAAIIPGSEVVRVAKSGHSVYFERRQQFNQIVDGFLSKHFPFSSSGTTIISHYWTT
jgi:3-oxoadipate enol-lactonase